jgi:hypothetical protein
MSNITLSANAGGTGIFTIASPNSNTNRTLDLPDSSGTILTTATPGVPVNGPAFSAFLTSLQSITSTVYTKVQLGSEEFDTNSCFNNTGSTVGGIPAYAFLPNVAGYYQVNGAIFPNTVTSLAISAIYKNGAINRAVLNQSSSVGAEVSAVIYLNGSTDYIELYAYLSGSGPQLLNSSIYTFFQAFLARAA